MPLATAFWLNKWHVCFRSDVTLVQVDSMSPRCGHHAALWLIPVSSPCPAPTVPKCPHVSLTHLLSLSLYTSLYRLCSRWWFMSIRVMQRSDLKVSHLFFPINSSWVEQFRYAARTSRVGMTCFFWYLGVNQQVLSGGNIYHRHICESDPNIFLGRDKVRKKLCLCKSETIIIQ